MSKKANQVQGEGDYEAAKKYNKKTKEFVKENKDTIESEEHQNLTEKQKNEGISAEEVGRARARK